MISSNNNLLFAYVLYLIGRTEYRVEEFTLRKSIAQWFFMSAVTGRFTGSPETAMEFDLAHLRDVSDASHFVSRLQQVCDVSLTNDFWNVTLPNDLATSSPRSPSLFAYHAALVLLDAPVLYSSVRVADRLDGSTQARRTTAERHHLFPKGHLATMGISSTRETNQIANYAFLEWTDNVRISDQDPAIYAPQLKKRFASTELALMYHYHALPEDWELMEYRAFLAARRELMARIVREAYLKLTDRLTSEAESRQFDLTELIDQGESGSVEFKSTLRINLHTGSVDKRMELAVLKTVAGFLNTNGGTLIVGVSDAGTPVGIEADKFPNEDKMSLHFVNVVNARLGADVMTEIHVHFEDYEGFRVMVVRCLRSPRPVYVKDGEAEYFYVRTGPSTTQLKPSTISGYVVHRFNMVNV